MWMEAFKDKPVLSIAEGTKLGVVHDLLLDDSYLQIAGLVIGGSGLFGGRRQAVAYGMVRGIGPDAVMVSGRDALQKVGDSSPLGSAHRLGELRQEVMSESGVHLGRIEDVEFEPQTGALTALRFTPEPALAPNEADASVIARAEIVSIAIKMVVVVHAVVKRHAGEPEKRRAQDLGQLVGADPASEIASATEAPATDSS